MDINAIAEVAMQNDAVRLDTISQNIANLSTSGYKRQVAAPVGFDTHLQRAGMQLRASRSLGIDPAAGALRPSTNANDVAIEGGGFFVVSSSDTYAYTRQGGLHVGVDGVLLGSQGLPIMGWGGAIRLNNSPFSVDSRGDVSQAGSVVGQIKIVQFEHGEKLIPLGNAMYAQGEATVADKLLGHSIRSGFLEASNVNSPQEMVRLSETLRHFEALQKVVQGYDESLEKTIRKLGDF
jgi:flagellar basal-body rod protein FlgF